MRGNIIQTANIIRCLGKEEDRSGSQRGNNKTKVCNDCHLHELSCSPVDRKTGRDGLRALGTSRGEGGGRGRVLKQHLDILYFNPFFFSGHSSHSMYPPTFWHISCVISLG